MAIYLKKFENHTQYENYINGSSAILPNVSICTTEGDVHYIPKTEPQETRVVATFNVIDTSNPTRICGYMEPFDPEFEPGEDYSSGFTNIEIDGVMLPTVSYQHQFDTLGEHTVKYTLLDSTTIGQRAFMFCTRLTSIDIPNSVTSIGDEAFNTCTSLTSIDIPNSVTSIGQSPFQYCSSLTSMTVNSNNLVYDSRNNCNAIIETNTNTLIQGCKATIIQNTVTSIDTSSFHGISGLTSIAIPNSVTSIGAYAFASCTNLTSIVIPDSVISIGVYAFNGCEDLTSVTVEATTPPTLLGANVFNATNDCPIYVPSASVAAYKSATNWNNYASRIQAIP